MKKLKLIPGLILLALCVAVLGIGIYAAAPASNTITGTVSVTAANAEVEISVYEDDYDSSDPTDNLLSTGTTRTGLNLSMGSFNFDASGANTKYDVAYKEIIIVVKNHSTTQDLGMYFWKTSADDASADNNLNVNTTNNDPEKGCVLVSDVLYGHHKYASTNSVADVIDVEYEFYKHLPVAADTDSDSDIDETDYTARAQTIRMYIRLDKMVESNVTVNLNVHLNIEKYVSNYSDSQTGFVKVGTANLTSGTTMPTTYANGLTHLTLPYGTTAVLSNNNTASWLANTSLETVGIPSSVTSIAKRAFAGCSELSSIIIPNTLSNEAINDYVFSTCSSLTTIIIPSTIAYVEQYAFYDSGLVSVVLESVSGIWAWGFGGCLNLEAAVFGNTGDWRIADAGDHYSFWEPTGDPIADGLTLRTYKDFQLV